MASVRADVQIHQPRARTTCINGPPTIARGIQTAVVPRTECGRYCVRMMSYFCSRKNARAHAHVQTDLIHRRRTRTLKMLRLFMQIFLYFWALRPRRHFPARENILLPETSTACVETGEFWPDPSTTRAKRRKIATYGEKKRKFATCTLRGDL